jgi:hypothetical protein
LSIAKAFPFWVGFWLRGDDDGSDHFVLGFEVEEPYAQRILAVIEAAGAFPKWESLKINREELACFSSPKNDRQRTSVSPATHHKFTSEKPRSAHPFLPKPPAKTG